MKTLLTEVVWSKLYAMGMFHVRQQRIDDAIAQTGMITLYTRWMKEWLRLFHLAGYIAVDQTHITLLNPPAVSPESLQQRWRQEKQKWQENRCLRAQMVVLDSVVSALPEILTGKVLATEILFPNASLALVEEIYKTSPVADYFNHTLSDKVTDYIRWRMANEAHPQIRIVEIGAGTGATSALMFEKLKAYQPALQEYCYTDISSAFLNHAEKSYAAQNPFLTYRLLNIENSIADQGFIPGEFDIVIAANVLHATKNMRNTMRNVKALLRKNGLIFLNEFCLNNLFSHMTFGMLEGWWYYDDEHLRIPGSPGLSEASWTQVLEAEGFRSVSFVVDNAQSFEQQIIIAESDGLIRQAQPSAKPDAAAAEKLTRSAAAAESPAADAVYALIIAELSHALRIDKNKIIIDEPFSSYGVDSILAVNIINTINDKLATELDVTAMFEHTTVEQLSAHMSATFPAELQSLSEPDAPADTGGAVAENTGGQNKADDQPAAPVVEESIPAEKAGASAVTGEPVVSEDDIAIIGMDGQFSDADTIQQLWRNLESGHCAIGPVTPQRREWAVHAGEVVGSFLDDIHSFDAPFFSIPLAEAKLMPPEQRLMLMSVWNSVENAGYTAKALSTETTGVFIAAGPSEYQQVLRSKDQAGGLINIPTLAMMPNRVSWHFNLRGPSEYYDTTCSSSLVALRHAVESLRKGECNYAIVAGINLIMSPEGFNNLDTVGMLSKTGSVSPFQQGAVGTVRGEGTGAVLLKPLRSALVDNDNISAIIKGVGVAHGGKGVSLTAPNIQGMKLAMQKALENARVSAASISWVEAHGMASTLADGAEIAALKSAYAEPSSSPLYITSLKPCLGHTEVVSGFAALFRTVMAMDQQTIPGIAHFSQLNPQISLQGSRLKMAEKSMPWQVTEGDSATPPPRRAAINSFGISGINAHVILQEAPPRRATVDEGLEQIIILSAQNRAQLLLRIAALRDFCQQNPRYSLADIAGTLQFGRTMMPARFALIATSIADLTAKLTQYLTEGDSENLISSSHSEENSALTELFSGEAGAEILGTLLQQNKVWEIVKYWCAGAAVDWRLLQRDDYYKVPLPGYPFQHIDCWPDDPSHAAVESSEPQPESAAISPVLNYLAKQLGVRRGEIDLTRSLADYAVNSLMFMVIHKQLSQLAAGSDLRALKIDTPLRAILALLNKQPTAAASTLHFPELIHLNDIQQGMPVFWIHGALGSVESYQFLAESCSRPFYGIEARGAMSDHPPLEGIAAIADYYLQIIKTVQPNGPYDIGGYCLGGIIAYEISRKLQLENEKVNSLVMIDSPDNQGFNRAAQSANIPRKNAALQVANTLLWPTAVDNVAEIGQQMIHQDDVDESLSDDDFIAVLGVMVYEKGANIDAESAREFIRRNINVQVAYQINNYQIQPLPAPEEINALYFRNKNGYFLGALTTHFQTRTTTFCLDHINYWQEWQREMADLQLIDLNVANHMTILFEEEAKAVVKHYCDEIYITEKVME